MNKKQYIEPKMDVITIMSRSVMLSSSNLLPGDPNIKDVSINPETMGSGDGGGAAAREVILSPDPWEEW